MKNLKRNLDNTFKQVANFLFIDHNLLEINHLNYFEI